MSVKVENLEEKNMSKITFEVPFDEFNKAVEKVYNKQKSRISVPGFRKGKVPRAMVEKMYGAEVFYEDAINEVLPEAYPKAAEESGLDIVSRPEIDIEKLEKGETVIFTAVVATRPEITLKKYEGVSVTKVDTKVTDEDIEAELKKEQEKNAREVVVERAIETGDVAVIDFDGSVDGVPFQGGKGDNYPLEIGSGTFIPGFEDQLIGAKTGDEVDVKVTFPADYQADDLAGKDAVFKCTVHEVKAKELPAIDDDLADDAGFDSLDAFKADIKERLEKQKADSAKSAQIDEAVAAIIEDAEVEIPEAMINTQVEQNFANFANRIMAQGMNIEQYLQFSGMTEEAMKEQMKPSTIEQIKTTLALDKIAKEQNLEATDAEVDEEIENMAKMYGMEVDKLKDIIPESEKKAMKDEIAAKKAMDYIYDKRKEKAATKKKAAKKDEAEADAEA